MCIEIWENVHNLNQEQPFLKKKKNICDHESLQD